MFDELNVDNHLISLLMGFFFAWKWKSWIQVFHILCRFVITEVSVYMYVIQLTEQLSQTFIASEMVVFNCHPDNHWNIELTQIKYLLLRRKLFKFGATKFTHYTVKSSAASETDWGKSQNANITKHKNRYQLE